MKQFLLKEKPDKDRLVRLRDNDYHYLVNVRRLKPGGIFSALLPADNTEPPQLVSVTVQSIDNHTLTGSVTAAQAAGNSGEKSNNNSVPIILFQALPKGSKMDLIVRQAAETGVSEVVPFISEHSVPKKNTGGERLSRWQRIIKEARQQSGSATATQLRKVLSTDELFACWDKITETRKDTLGLILNHRALDNDGFHRYLNNKPSLIALAVGPEGGFSAAEQNRFEEAGFKAVSLGSTVLRTETAALFGTAAVKIILMEGEWWNLQLQ